MEPESDQHMMNEDDGLDQLDDIPDLFHKSSLKERTDPELQNFSDQIYSVKKIYDEHNNTRINEFLEMEELGRGAFGVVTKVERVKVGQDQKKSQHTGQFFAMKTYSKVQLRGQRFFAPDGDFADALQMLQNEINIMKRLQHPNLTKCYQIMRGSDKIYMVMELGNLGQIMKWNSLELKYYRNPAVHEYILKRYSIKDRLDVTRIIFLQVCEATRYMHQNNITNRDIKVDNILCKGDAPLGQEIKVTDFTTIRYSKDDISYFPSGTPGFRGPQHQFASSQGYSCKASDMWSIGISMYTYYNQFFPYYGESELQIDIKAKNQPLVHQQDCPYWFKQLIEKMCHKQWKHRISVHQAIQILKEAK